MFDPDATGFMRREELPKLFVTLRYPLGTRDPDLDDEAAYASVQVLHEASQPSAAPSCMGRTSASDNADAGTLKRAASTVCCAPATARSSPPARAASAGRACKRSTLLSLLGGVFPFPNRPLLLSLATTTTSPSAARRGGFTAGAAARFRAAGTTGQCRRWAKDSRVSVTC